MATITPVSPHEEVDNDNQQPPITGSPPLPIECVDHHQQFADSVSLSSPPQQPENSADRQQHPPPEDVEGQQEPPVPPSPPPEEKFDRQQPLEPPSPPPTGTEQPPENFSPNRESPLSKQSPSPPPTETEQPPENFSPNRESPLSKQQPSPSLSPSSSTPPTVAENPAEIPDYGINPNPTSDHESPLSKQSPSSGPDHHVAGPNGAENPAEIPDYGINPNPASDHESPLSKQSPSSGPDDHVARPNYRRSPNPNPNLDHESPSPSSPANVQGNHNPKDPSPSPPLTTGSPSSPPDTVEPNTTVTPPLGVPLLLHAAAGSSLIKPQISPWTPQETANLIQAYQEKWYSLKKGPLKAGQWEEVAITVAARCGYDEPTKTSKQCRHKLEKLRKRYRTEQGKPRSKAIAWNFFKLMDNLEKGPLPISSSPPMALVEYQKPSSSNGKKRKNDDDDDEDDDGDREFRVNKRSSRSKTYDHHVPNGYLTRNLRFSDGGNRVVRGLRTPVVHKHKGFYQEDDGDNEEEEEEEEQDGDNGGEEEGVAAQLAVEIKGFAEKFVKMENKKIEMIRDVERYRLEMENKRIQMILESQQMLVETVNKAFHKTHKLSS